MAIKEIELRWLEGNSLVIRQGNHSVMITPQQQKSMQDAIQAHRNIEQREKQRNKES